MLVSLKVKNYALISDISLHFSEGLNIITGETGAGKSILMDALGLSLGQRADGAVLKHESSKCVIESTFDIRAYNFEKFFNSNDLDYEQQTILRREITSSGKSRSFINDTPVNLKQLAELGSQLIELHSQYDNLQLFKASFQFKVLDCLSNSLKLQKSYTQLYQNYLANKLELNELQQNAAEAEREREFNQFQYDELVSAQLEQAEEEKLNTEQEILENAESLIELFKQVEFALNDNDYAVNNQLTELLRQFQQHRNSISGEVEARLKSVLIELKDIADEVSNLSSSIELNPARLQEVNDRLALIFSLRSKHRANTLEELFDTQQKLGERLSANLDLNHRISELNEIIKQQEAELKSNAQELHKARTKSLDKIAEKLNSNLIQLGMKHSKLRFSLNKESNLSTYGYNTIDIELSSDQGNNYSSIRKSASGGELARINLIIKGELANYTSMPTSVFDEIDTGVSGEIARKVGSQMLKMANNQQLIVITHLAQIASLGSSHFYLYKEVGENGVSTHVKAIEGDERINEIAKMISGENLTESAIEQSKQLLKF